MGLIGDIFAGRNSAHAATKAANAGVTGAEKAQALELQNQQDALKFQSGVWNQDQANQQPYLSLGQTSANNLSDFLKNPFVAPTLEEAKQNPGYQFALDTGTAALDKSAAARGNVFSGTQGTALQEFGQGLGEQNYEQVYNRAMQNYMSRYNTLMGGTQVGQTATGQFGQQGQAAAVNTANVDLTGAQQQAQQINNAAAARASGYLGSANAYNNMLKNMNDQASSAAMMFGLGA